MREKFFYYTAWTIVICMWLSFLLVILFVEPETTGYAVSEDANSSTPIIFVFIILFVGIIFVAMTQFQKVEMESQSESGQDRTIEERSVSNTYNIHYPSVDEFIHNSFLSGYNAQQISQALLDQGWPQDYVSGAVYRKYYELAGRPKKKQRIYTGFEHL